MLTSNHHVNVHGSATFTNLCKDSRGEKDAKPAFKCTNLIINGTNEAVLHKQLQVFHFVIFGNGDSVA